MSDPSDVLIIGGGIIGVACADELARRGVSVTVVDKGEIGFGCSYGNAGWITPCFAMPLPMPGMLLQSIRWLLNPDSPLYIRPRPSLELLRWLARFGLSMNQRQMQRSIGALAPLATYSLDVYKQLDAESPGSFGFVQKGLLIAAESRSSFDAAVHELELMAPHGIPGRRVSADEARSLEPLLARADLTGGVYFSNEAHAEPLAAVRALAQRAERNGARMLPHTEVFDFVRSNSAVGEVRTSRGPMRAKSYVVAAGSWSNRMGRSLGFRVPILAGKGYSVIVEPIDPRPSIPVMLLDRKIALTPRRDSLRIAGTLELVGSEDLAVTSRRVDTMMRGAMEALKPEKPPRVLEVWRGLRPCTPDGVPIIDRTPDLQNVFVAAGHQMIGLLSAPGTARLLADLVTGQKPLFEPGPFRASR